MKENGDGLTSRHYLAYFLAKEMRPNSYILKGSKTSFSGYFNITELEASPFTIVQ